MSKLILAQVTTAALKVLSKTAQVIEAGAANVGVAAYSLDYRARTRALKAKIEALKAERDRLRTYAAKLEGTAYLARTKAMWHGNDVLTLIQELNALESKL